ncbi:hypothetical protein [Caldalkalibacillus mannanilyticus]|uniref:hypothetical protein n=1 Tax=Caldalkalibacillus mannanilyticus TaxID=1418 RepID=UPI000468A8F5|nr:hypothetical protein [Caldalkalibacillus mannanilyticus]
MRRISLQQRLRAHIGRRLAISAQDFQSEPGLLQAVGKKFIRVSGQFFVPLSVNQLVLFNTLTRVRTIPVVIRSTFRGTFQAGLREIGEDYIEIIEKNGNQRVRILIPLNKVISIEKR